MKTRETPASVKINSGVEGENGLYFLRLITSLKEVLCLFPKFIDPEILHKLRKPYRLYLQILVHRLLVS